MIMKYLFSWLKDYYQTDKTVKQTGEDLVSLGSDVEGVVSSRPIDEKVIAVKIVNIEPHPNADRLRLATVSDGKIDTTLVCGAPNIEIGQVVPMAQIGARLDDIEVKEVEIRGIKSAGMLCSEKELALGGDHAGINILPVDIKLGTKISDLITLDEVLELEITPNRGDLLSHFGLARDLSAKAGKLLEKPELEFKESDKKASDVIKVEVQSDNCLLYLARVIVGVKIAPSPKWLQTKLIAVGAKPINNVVDATNYIMLDLGHPLHAFDEKKISPACHREDEGRGDLDCFSSPAGEARNDTRRQIIVKEFAEDMEVVTLDGEAREVIAGMLGIWDGKRPVAIAGVMGLANSEVDSETKDIVLEAAVFDRKSIRKTAKLLNLKTEASARFERGVDEDGVKYAIDKAAKMIAELAGGEILSGIADIGKELRITRLQAPKRSDGGQENKELRIEYEKINSYANLNLKEEKIDKILTNLGFNIKNSVAEIPAWRHDIAIWQDLAEEIYRINGLKKISPEPLSEMQKAKPSDYYKKEKIKDCLAELGLDEAISYTFLSDADVIAAKLDPTDLLEVANPVQDENRYLRNSLIPGLLKAVAKNPSFDDIEFFELGNVFSKTDEWTSLAIATSGKSARKSSKIVSILADILGVKGEVFKVYEIDREELKRFKIKKPFVSIAEARVSDLLSGGKFDDLKLLIPDNKIEYRPISKFPPVKRDLAFVVDVKIPALEIKNSILEISPNLVLVEIFDEFINDRFGKDKKSIAFHVWLQNLDKTLSDGEANTEISNIISTLLEKFGAKLRD